MRKSSLNPQTFSKKNNAVFILLSLKSPGFKKHQTIKI